MTSWYLYLLPIVFIVGGLLYSQMARKRIASQVASGQGPELFHNGFAQYFSELGAGEYLVGVWTGVAYTGSTSALGQAAKGVANALAERAIGVSSYIPMVFVGVTTEGRVLVAEEFSEFGQRGQYKVVRCWGPGVSAVTGAAAVPGHEGPAPKNQVGQPVALASLSGPDGQSYQAWLGVSGFELGNFTRPISSALPTTVEQCRERWAQAKQAHLSPAAAAG